MMMMMMMMMRESARVSGPSWAERNGIDGSYSLWVVGAHKERIINK